MVSISRTKSRLILAFSPFSSITPMEMFRASDLFSVSGPVEYIIPSHDFGRECLGVREFRH